MLVELPDWMWNSLKALKIFFQNIEVTRKILDMMGKPHSLIGVSNDRPGVDKRYGTDFSKLTERTGWVPQIPFDAGLAGTVSFYLNK